VFSSDPSVFIAEKAINSPPLGKRGGALVINQKGIIEFFQVLIN
jgi:hypothetical protein